MAKRTIYDERARVEEIRDLRTRLAAAEARAARMEAALTAARDKFAEYCSVHMSKGTLKKALANRRLASMCATALATDGSALAQAIEDAVDWWHSADCDRSDPSGVMAALRRAWGQR